MKIIVGMDSFKGSLSTQAANDAVSKGVKSVFEDADIRSYVMADGGEGTTKALIDGLDGVMKKVSVTGPLGAMVDAEYGFVGDEGMAVIEIAEAAGLTLLTDDELDPYKTTTYGVGEMINHAYEAGARQFIIGLGGSATNDGGAGMLQALGYQFKDEAGREIGRGGGALSQIDKVIKTPEASKYDDCHFRVACDVNNLLYGTEGATYVFGPQKGVTEEMLPELDAGLKIFADVTERQMDMDISKIEGGGAAGGLGAAFYGYLNGYLESGIQLVIDLLDMEKEIRHADLIITGEGRLDAQTSMGKVPAGLAKSAEKYEVPIIAFGGSVTDDAYELVNHDLDAIFSIQHYPVSLQEAMKSSTTRFNLEKTVSQVMAVFSLGSRHKNTQSSF